MKQQHSVRKTKLLSLGLCAAFLLTLFASPQQVRADVVTDTLKVCVGYTGMELTEYVTVGDYHWSELEQNLPIYEEAYSYYSGGLMADEYNAIVDAAHGFLISDLLSYANVYYGDIYNILFYVEDAKTVWAAFDRDSLFCTRYYFEDLAGHRRIIYGTKEQQVQVGETPIIELQPVLDPETGEPLLDEAGEPVMEEVVVGYEPVYETRTVTDYTKIEGYDFEEAWDYSYPVEPMLALEDNWVSFNETFEHVAPDFSYMSTGSRFRLLFGQLYPTETMTHDSAKYVSRVYVTLTGMPRIGQMPDEIDDELGAHEITVEIADIYNSDMVDQLSEYLQLSSTNEDVLQIDDIQFENTDYSDVAVVTIRYSIVGTGTASISLGIGGTELTDSSGTTLSQATRIDTSPEAGGETPPEDESTDSETPPEEGGGETAPEDQGTGGQDTGGEPDEGDAPSGDQSGTGESAGTPAEPTPSPDSGDSDSSPEQAATPTDTGGDDQASGDDPSDGASQDTDQNTDDTGDQDTLTLDQPEEHADYDALAPEEASQDGESPPESLSVGSASAGFLLTGSAAEQMEISLDISQPAAVPDRSLTEVVMEDTTEEKAAEERRMLLFTGLGLFCIGLAGAGSELLAFRQGLRKKLKKRG